VIDFKTRLVWAVATDVVLKLCTNKSVTWGARQASKLKQVTVLPISRATDDKIFRSLMPFRSAMMGLSQLKVLVAFAVAITCCLPHV
jgi:hypothetical protein